MNVGILGANGYAGELLLSLLLTHPKIKKIYAASRSLAEQALPLTIQNALLHKQGAPEIAESYCSIESLIKRCENGEIDVLFSALPHGASADVFIPILRNKKAPVIIDLSADFRYTQAELYKRVYKRDHADASMLKYAVYGLSEWNREHIQKARIIACPGCYPTSVLLPLIPVLRYAKPTGSISVVASSGVTGAGKACKPHLLFTERTESILPYSVGTQHRHVSEMVHQLARLCHLEGEAWNMNAPDAHSPLIFMPQLVPLARGLLSVISVPLSSKEGERAAASLVAQYAGEPWVRVCEENTMPETAHVRGTNLAAIGYRCEANALILCCAIDNLGKGAAGQAVQNFNIRFGFTESLGLAVMPS